MSSVPRPLVAVLAIAVLFFALWTVALKKTLTGGSSGSGAGSPSTPVLQSTVNKARGLQAVVNSASAKAGGTPAQSAPPATTQSTPPATTTPAATTPATTSTPTHSAKGNSSAASAVSPSATTSAKAAQASPLPQTQPTGLALVAQALHQHKVLALLVFNPAAADDRAVSAEFRSIPTHNGQVVKMTVPVQKLGAYSSLLNEVPVNFSPTLVLIDHHRQADEIAGFADSFEIAQRVSAALGWPPAKHSGPAKRTGQRKH